MRVFLTILSYAVVAAAAIIGYAFWVTHQAKKLKEKKEAKE